MNETQQTVNASPGGLKIHPPLLAAVLLVGTLILHALFETSEVEGHEVLGLLLVAGGIGVSFFAAALFQARATTKNPYGEPAQFVVEMPYTFTRNPMYLGLATALLGFAIFFGSIVMLLAPIGFFIVLDRVVIPNEEASMERMFGQQYLDYKTRVRRWL
jgi:protein-S-isoprenylcysteine O-methyltransferase Ste14